jgi:lipopolysaccharide/colanic/teichoic acid biosynthesis glycosyltransferase
MTRVPQTTDTFPDLEAETHRNDVGLAGGDTDEVRRRRFVSRHRSHGSRAKVAEVSSAPAQADLPADAQIDAGGGVALSLRTAVGRRQLLERTLGAARRIAKRGFDLVGALLLVLLLAPFWITVALLIKADSPGPVLFRQRRIGRNGEPFMMLKFRTMVDGADARKPALLAMNQAADGLFKIYDDPRVTGVGRRLRATWLDELPQLLQVVTGKMSLVGPRPLVPEEDAQIEEDHRRRHTMRPGMTGAWQVGGAWSIPIDEMAALDCDYVDDWSLWLDLKILVRTAWNVVRRRGA